MSENHNVILAGTGGRGVLVAARILAEAGLCRYSHVSWLPSMTTAPRGGPCEATVVLSDEFIASPLVWQPQAIIIMESTQLEQFIPRVLPRGLIITEKSGLEKSVSRKDITALEIPALAISLELTGDTMAANLVLLGAYIRASNILPAAGVENVLESRFAGKDKILTKNLAAFRKGLNATEAL